MPDRRPLTSTYRLQLHAGFTFADAAQVVGHLARLGISHLYLSPILQAAPGSTHGYDVVDHARISAHLGGESGLEELSKRARAVGLGMVVDVVPNHMTIPAPEHLNRQLWQTLRGGRTAPTAHWFDVDWDAADGTLVLPILGAPLPQVIAEGELTYDVAPDGTDAVRYFDHLLPIAPGSEGTSMAETLSRQHYTLVPAGDAETPLNYRRFFDVDTLIAVRVELDDVFQETHRVLLDLYDDGVVDGFRVDHPDGLADPARYLDRLRDATDGGWVVVEKILEPGEQLPTGWATAGTTGYDAIRAIQGAFVPDVAPELTQRWIDAGGGASYSEAELASKRDVIAGLFGPELAWLTRLAGRAAAAGGEDLAVDLAREALTELLAHVDVYRVYLQLDQPVTAEAQHQLDELLRRASSTRPELAATLQLVVRLLAQTRSGDPATRDLVVRFQQVCGPVMAKGVEDTVYYRWLRMVGLNEVGGDPRALDTPSVDALHDWAIEQATRRPMGMTTLSTHDTKRSEDVRARLLAVAEDTAGWSDVCVAARAAADRLDVDARTAHLLAQTLLGSWPIDADRLHGYLEKAMREAKLATGWLRPDEQYETRVHALADACRERDVADPVERVLATDAAAIRAVTLGSKLIQLTLPGVPDVYQGMETVELSLVDPDNRRPVDFTRRAALLQELKEHGQSRIPTSEPADRLDLEKLWVTSRALDLRKSRPDVFLSGGYQPLRSTSRHLIGFTRGRSVAVLATRWPTRVQAEGWGDATVDLPPGRWVDVIGEGRLDVGNALVRADDVLSGWPVALLVQEA